MIIVMKKSSISLVAVGLLILTALFCINFDRDSNLRAANNAPIKKTILLDAGHGGEDPGAVSGYNGIKEKEINLSIVLKLKELLEAENYNVLLTRSEDKLEYSSETRNIVQKRKEDLLRRKGLMDNSGADIVVSVHLNKFPESKYFGAQTFFPPGSDTSRKLAMMIQKSIKENVDPQNIREALVKDTKPPIIILKDVKTTTVIVECGFLSNEEEEKKLANKEYQDKLAYAIKEGIKKYYEN